MIKKDYFSDFIKDLSFREQIYEKIKRLIILNKLKPGERLVEVSLAKSMNISRGPLREALNRLDVEGYVDILPHKGTIVHQVDQREVIDTFDFFNILYYHLIISVFDKITPSEIAPFIDELESIDISNINKDDFMDIKIDIDHKFYISFLIPKNGNMVFAKYIDILHGKIHWYRSISKVIRPFENSIKDRIAIYQAIKKKDKHLIYLAVMKNSEDSKKYSIV